ncbi:MAG: hypothetical protein ACRDZT_03605 [Acidimicrobiales bacterium]
MNGLAPLLEQFTLPEISRVLRRTIFAALGIGVAAVIATLFLSYPLFGLGVCIGLGAGLMNIRMITSQTARVTAAQPERPARALASMTIARLGITTVVVIGLAIVAKWLGLGAAAGLCVFYFVFVANIVTMMVRHKATP